MVVKLFLLLFFLLSPLFPAFSPQHRGGAAEQQYWTEDWRLYKGEATAGQWPKKKNKRP